MAMFVCSFPDCPKECTPSDFLDHVRAVHPNALVCSTRGCNKVCESAAAAALHKSDMNHTAVSVSSLQNEKKKKKKKTKKTKK